MSCINFFVFLFLLVLSSSKHAFYSLFGWKFVVFILLMRKMGLLCFSITFRIMTGKFWQVFVKTSSFRNPVFGVPWLAVISHNAETNRNGEIKNTLDFKLENSFAFIVFFNFYIFFQYQTTSFTVLMLKKIAFSYFY